MSDRDPTAPPPAILAAEAANDDNRAGTLAEALESWRVSLEEEHAYHETGELPDPRTDMMDLRGATEAAALEVALAPARTLEELTLKAEVADYFLGGLEKVEAALAAEVKGKQRLQELMALGLLRDLLRLVPGKGRAES